MAETTKTNNPLEKSPGLVHELGKLFGFYLGIFLLTILLATFSLFFYAGVKTNNIVQWVVAILASLPAFIIVSIFWISIARNVKKFWVKRGEEVSINENVVKAEHVDAPDHIDTQYLHVEEEVIPDQEKSDIEELMSDMKRYRTQMLFTFRRLESIREEETSPVLRRDLENLIRLQREESVRLIKPNSTRITHILSDLAKKVFRLSN